MPEKKSRRHHFIPRAILKRFASPQQQVHYLEKGNGPESVELRNIRSIFWERHYYSTVNFDGVYDDVVEKRYFAKVDNLIGLAVDEVEKDIASHKVPELAEDLVVFLRKFIIMYSKRTPDAISSAALIDDPRRLVQEQLDNLPERFGFLTEERRRLLLDDASVERIVRFARVGMQAKMSPLLDEAMSRLKIVFAVSDARKTFAIGSNPVLRLENKIGATLGDGVELWTPIASGIYLGFVDVLSKIDSVVIFRDPVVRKLNVLQFKQSSAIASRSRELLASLARIRR